MSSSKISPYYDFENVDQSIKEGKHREIVGGLWDEIGRLQFELMRTQGLLSNHKLLDIGCGSLRGGVHFIKYLDDKNYFGIDINSSIIDAGYEYELDDDLRNKLPKDNLKAIDDFDFSSFNIQFNFAIALSVFTHLPLNHIRICLERLADAIPPGGKFIASFFEIPETASNYSEYLQKPGNITTYSIKDPYHYKFSDFQNIAAGMPWTLHYLGDLQHPRNQKFILFERNDTDIKKTKTDASSTRYLSCSDAQNLTAGDEHYRSYVGPPDRYDFMSATQFSLLFQTGLREHHKVLDFGCGSLRLGRLLIPFLKPNSYYGIDPNKWLIEDAVKNELGSSALSLKSPHFDYNANYDCSVFNEKFDFIIAQSIITHTGPDLTARLLSSVKDTLAKNGVFLFSYIKNQDASLPEDGWHYPGCIAYSESGITSMLKDEGLFSCPIPWYHPAASWHIAALSADALPNENEAQYLGGVITRDKQFLPHESK